MSRFTYKFRFKATSLEFNFVDFNLNIHSLFERKMNDSKLSQKESLKLQKLIDELQGYTLPQNLIRSINYEIKRINDVVEQNEKIWFKRLDNGRNEILNLLRKEACILPKNYFFYRCLVFGLLPFDLPMGLFFLYLFSNGFSFWLGFFIGFLLSGLVGKIRDRYVAKQNRQLKQADWDFSIRMKN